MKPLPDSAAFTPQQVMECIGISKTTLWRIEKLGYVKALPLRRPKLFTRKSVEAFIAGDGKGSK